MDDIIEGIVHVIHGAPEKRIDEDGLSLLPYTVDNIGGLPEKLLIFISTLQEKPVRWQLLPEDGDFESHRQLVGTQPGDVPVTYGDTNGLA